MRFKFLFAAFFWKILPSLAQVNLAKPITTNGFRLFPDSTSNALYYTPKGIQLIQDRDGKPDFRLIMLRYTGRKLSLDQQKRVFRNICQFKIAMKFPTVSELADIQSQFPGKILKRLSPAKTTSSLIYNPAIDSLSARVLPGEPDMPNESVGDEATITIRISDADAQLLEKAIAAKQTLISVGFAFFADPKGLVMMRSGSLGLHLPGERESYIRKIDLNEQLPAEFAAVSVRCYDFNNNLREDLYAKKVEIRAFATDGKPIECQATFYKKSPETFSANVRFNYAVRIDFPLRFRVTEIFNDGRTFVKGWTEQPEWGLVDVTGK